MELYPSMMCADPTNLARETRDLDLAGVDAFHCDVMDGCFVPNFTLGVNDIRAIKASTKKPVDAHLMIMDPLSKLDLFISAGADIIYIHPEAERFCAKALLAIRAAGRKAGLAINPETPVCMVEDLLPLVDYLMVMTVSPGFAGQAFLEFTLPKIRRFAELKDLYGYKLVIDGACSPERIEQLSELGADAFVLGTSALFGKGDYATSIDRLKQREPVAC